MKAIFGLSASAPAARRGVGGDEGAAVVLVVALVAVVVTLTGLLGLLGRVHVAAATAGTAADLAALAAADVLRLPLGVRADPAALSDAVACAAATQTAERNGAALVRCTSEGAGVVLVTVEHDGPLGTVRASARAGPPSG